MRRAWALAVVAVVVASAMLSVVSLAAAAPRPNIPVDLTPASTATSLGILASSLEPNGYAAVSTAYDKATHQLYVSTDGPFVSVVNSTAIVANIPISSDGGIGQTVYDPANGYVYVPVFGVSNVPPSNGVVVLNGLSVLGTVTILDHPFTPSYTLYDAADGDVYVGDNGGNIYILNGTAILGHIMVGVLSGLTYDSHHGFVYAAADKNVTVIHGATVVGRIASDAGGNSVAVTYDSENYCVYISEAGSSSIAVVNGTTVLADVTSIDWILSPGAGVYDISDRMVYILDLANSPVGNNSGSWLDVINGTSFAGTVPMGAYATQIVYSMKLGEVFARGLGSYPNWNGVITVVRGMSVVTNVSVGYVPYEMSYNPGTGNVTVGTGGNITTIGNGTFTNTTIVQAGLPGGTQWSASSDAVSLRSTGTMAPFKETHGVQSYEVPPVPGYIEVGGAGIVHVGVDRVLVHVTFVTYYAVNITESGLPAGTAWSVRIGTTTLTSTNDSIVFYEKNGGHYIVVLLMKGYRITPRVSLIVIHDAPRSVSVVFTPLPVKAA